MSSEPTPTAVMRPSEAAALMEQALFEVQKVIVGQERMVERMLACLLAKGHCLLEGVPGVAKTLAVQTLATVCGGSFVRLQFTPDLVPSDIVGTRVYRAGQDSFDVELGPVFANFVLADEINRAPAKVQSALLEVMAEHQVSIAGITHPLPDPFLVLATQNPIESEGVYPLPEAQRDRFLMRVHVPYPSELDEMEIVRRMGVHPPHPDPVLTPATLIALQEAVGDVFVHHAVVQYAVRLVLATRNPAAYGITDIEGQLAYGASPRASLGLVAAGRALALLRGRDYVVPADVADIVMDVLPHRLVLSFDAMADGRTTEEITARILAGVAQPRVAPRQGAPMAAPIPTSGYGEGLGYTGTEAPDQSGDTLVYRDVPSYGPPGGSQLPPTGAQSASTRNLGNADQAGPLYGAPAVDNPNDATGTDQGRR